jgi:uncharacterized membrane protein YjdF
MSRTLLAGAVLAVFGALSVALGGVLGLELDHVALLGAALGAVIGLVPDRGPLARIAGFFAGVLVALAFFALRAAVLPDSATGRAVAVFGALIACMAISAATATKVPLWSILVGAAAVVGAYEDTYTAAPSLFLREAPAAVTTVLLAAAIGHLATTVVGPETERRRREASVSSEPREPLPPSNPDIVGAKESTR